MDQEVSEYESEEDLNDDDIKLGESYTIEGKEEEVK